MTMPVDEIKREIVELRTRLIMATFYKRLIERIKKADSQLVLFHDIRKINAAFKGDKLVLNDPILNSLAEELIKTLGGTMVLKEAGDDYYEIFWDTTLANVK